MATLSQDMELWNTVKKHAEEAGCTEDETIYLFRTASDFGKRIAEYDPKPWEEEAGTE